MSVDSQVNKQRRFPTFSPEICLPSHAYRPRLCHPDLFFEQTTEICHPVENIPVKEDVE
jgi:hypothetical protein